MDQNFAAGSGGKHFRQLLRRHFRSSRVQDVSGTSIEIVEGECTPPTPTSLSNNVIPSETVEHSDGASETETSVKVDGETKTLGTLKGVKFAFIDDHKHSDQSLKSSSSDQNQEKTEQKLQFLNQNEFNKTVDSLNDSSDEEENYLKNYASDDSNFSKKQQSPQVQLTIINEDPNIYQLQSVEIQKSVSNGEDKKSSTTESLVSVSTSGKPYIDSTSISTSSSSRQSSVMQRKTSSLKSNRVSPALSGAGSGSGSKTSSTKSRSDSRRRQDDQQKSETQPATIAEEEDAQTVVEADAETKVTAVTKADDATTSSQPKDMVKEKKSSKDIAKRKASVQHRNSKQETALLLRRKSLTPSTKLILLCKKGDWLAVETFLKQADRKTFDCTVVNEENNWTPIMYAAKDNRVSILEKLISLGFNVNAKANDGLTALHVACSNAREDTIKLLMLKRVDTTVAGGPKNQLALHIISSKPTGAAVVPVQLILKNSPKEIRLQKDGDGNIALLYAVEVGNHGLAKELLLEFPKEQMEVRRHGTGDGAIHLCAKRKDLEMLKVLVDRGCDINMKNKDGLTPLHIAALHNDEAMVRFIGGIDGLDPDIQDKKHRTALHIATEKGNTRMMDFLIDKCKASLSHRTKTGSTIMHLVCKSCPKEVAMQYVKKNIPLLMSDKTGSKVLHIAAMAGHVDIARIVLQKGEKVDSATREGYTALHLAVEARQDQIIELLLGSGASINAKTVKTGETPLHLAARTSNSLKCLSMLISSGARINERENNGETPLHLAARCGFADTFDRLIEEGARPDMLNNVQENALHISIRECHYAIVRKVIQYVRSNNQEDGQEMVRKLINKQNKNGETCMHLAAALTPAKAHEPDEQVQIMRLLIECGGEVTILNERQESCIHYAAREGATLQLQHIISSISAIEAQITCNALAKDGWSPLFYACKGGHGDTIQLLLKQNSRVDIFDEGGTAGLHLAAELGHSEACEVLLKNNAFVNVRNKAGMTPLHLAAKNGFVELVQNLVINHEALLDAMTLTKKTPLHLAAKSGQLEVCKTLLALNADVTAQDNESQTPLHLATQNNHTNVIKLFLETRPELLSMANKSGQTCVHIAAHQGSIEVLQELCTFNAEAVKFSVIKKTDSTALHLAVEGGFDKVAKFLLENGANASREDRAGMTALHIAAKFGHVKVLTILQGHLDFKLTSRKTGLTALHVAAKNGQTDFVCEMLDEVPGSIRSERSAVSPHSDFGFTPLHLAAQYGHEGAVRLLMNSTGVKVDEASELSGVIPLHLAAQGGHTIVANLLISRSTETMFQPDKFGRNAMHLAASRGRAEMIKVLIGQGAEINSLDSKLWSPLHYAAKYGYLEVVQLLIDNGANPLAETDEGKIALCYAVSKGHQNVLSYLLTKQHDSLALMEDAQLLIDLMKCAKTSAEERNPLEEFILKSNAPIETAIKLASKYDALSQKQKQIARDLELARDVCDNCAINLLSVVALTSDPGRLLRSIDHRRIQLLDVLLELERKEVVAQHAVQTYLSQVWLGELNTYSMRRWILLIVAIVFCPPVWALLSCPFRNRLANVPIIKFISYFTSHLYFILLLTVTTVYPSERAHSISRFFPAWYEWLLYMWLIGMLTSELVAPGDKSGLGAIKNVIIALGFVAIAVNVGAFVLETTYYSGNEEWHRAIKLDVYYSRNQVLGLVLLLSFVELLNFLTFHPLFGPWGVIIIEILIDLVRFLAVLLIFLVGFTLHISSIYIAVYAPKSSGLSSGYDFENVPQCFEMLFFALFGIVAHDSLPSRTYSPPFAKSLMKLVFGIYMTIVMIVLMNLLIAMMSNTYQRIDQRSDIEWKYGRAKLIRNMNRMLSTPPPINLVLGLGHKYFTELASRLEKQKKIKEQFAKVTLANLKLSPAAISAGKKWLHKTAAKRAQVRAKLMSPSKRAAAEAVESIKFVQDVLDWEYIVTKYYESYGHEKLRKSSISATTSTQLPSAA